MKLGSFEASYVLFFLPFYPFCSFVLCPLSRQVPPHQRSLTRFLPQLLLAVINILPWILAILYDACLYVGRVIYHEIPFFGGRARGEHRPRAPSLRDRVRRMSFVDLVTGTGSAPSTPTRVVTREDTTSRETEKTMVKADTQAQAQGQGRREEKKT